MESIQLHSVLLPLRTQLNHKHRQLHFSTINRPTKLSAPRQHFLSLSTKAMHNAIVLGVAPPAKSGDITVLLQIGGVLFLFYLFSNFVVPIFITKYFGLDKVGEDEDDDDLFNM